MNRARIALAAIVLFSAVCVAQGKPVEKWTIFKSWADLRSGMSENQVTMLLGQPRETTTSRTDSTNAWYYQQIPPEQTNNLCDGCVMFRKDGTGTYTLYRWQDPNWKQIENDKKEKETAIEIATQKAELEKQVALTQKKLEHAAKAKKALELKLQQQEEARENKAKMLAEFEAMEKEQKEEEQKKEEEEERTASSGFLDRLCGIVTERHFVPFLIAVFLFGVVLVVWRIVNKPKEKE